MGTNRIQLRNEGRDVSVILVILFLLLVAGLAGAEPKKDAPLPADFAKANQAALQSVAVELVKLQTRLNLVMETPRRFDELKVSLDAIVGAINGLAKRIAALEKIVEPMKPNATDEVCGTGPDPREGEAK